MEKKIKELINDVYKKSTTMPAKEPDKETIAAQEMYLETGLVPQSYVDSISKGRFNIKTHNQPHKTLRDILNELKGTIIPVDNNMRMCERKERDINLLLEPHGFRICRDKNTPHLPPILEPNCRVLIGPIEEEEDEEDDFINKSLKAELNFLTKILNDTSIEDIIDRNSTLARIDEINYQLCHIKNS